MLETDASKEGLGAMLSQKQSDGCYHLVTFGSHSLTPSEKNHHSSKLEFLALRHKTKNTLYPHINNDIEYNLFEDIINSYYLDSQTKDNINCNQECYSDICRATGIEEDPKATQDIRCLRQGGGAALIQTKQQFPQPKR